MIVALQIFIVQVTCRYYSGDWVFGSTRFVRLNRRQGYEELLFQHDSIPALQEIDNEC